MHQIRPIWVDHTEKISRKISLSSVNHGYDAIFVFFTIILWTSELQNWKNKSSSSLLCDMISYRTVFYFLPNRFVKNTNMCFATTHSSFSQLNKASVYNVPCYPIFGSLHEATTRSLTSFQFLKLLLLRSILKNTLLCSPISLYLSITIFIRQPLLQTLTQLPKFQNNNPRTKN